ncbi:MAG: NADH:flavin oxidoreductase [Defluviitaleaceae bacterium]|nr:NADH:flavin oxidoreductase [Defluviitaleaceae bacterium]
MAKMFDPIMLKGKKVKNRVVFPPGVCFDPGVVGGFISEATVEHYKRVAKAGCGIMIVEAACVVKDALITPMQLGIWDDSFVEGLSKLPPIAHAEGALALLQIEHSGVKTPASVTDDLVAPSVHTFGDNTARALEVAEIETICRQFIDAGVRAKKAGFDGVELHCCHGYLLNQFLSPEVNQRDDEYGKNRAKLALDILTGLRGEVGDDFIIAVRMPGNDPDLATCISYAKSFEAAGADLLHVSAGFVVKAPDDLVYEKNNMYNWIVATGIEIKKHVSVPVVVVNGIRTPEQAHHILETGGVDFIAIMKAYMCDFDWIEKARTGQEVIRCLPCKKCLRFTGMYNCVLTQEE